MNARNGVLSVMAGILACPVAVWADAAEDARIRDDRRQALFALTDLMLLARPNRTWDEGREPDAAVDFMLTVVLLQPHSAVQRYLDAKGDGPLGRRRIPVPPTGGTAPAVPTLEDKDLNRADREILAELDVPPPRPPAASGDDFVIRLFEMYTSLGHGWSEGAPGSRPPIRSTPEPVPPAGPSGPTPADFERITRESAQVYQDAVAATQRNAEDWQRRQEAIDRMQEAIQQTGDILRQQQQDWINRHPPLPAPPPTASRPPPPATSQRPPPTASKPPSQPEKPPAGSSGGQRSGSRTGGTVKGTSRPPSGGVKSPPPAPQGRRCQKCGKISPSVYYCQKCRMWHCRGE